MQALIEASRHIGVGKEGLSAAYRVVRLSVVDSRSLEVDASGIGLLVLRKNALLGGYGYRAEELCISFDGYLR